MAATLSSQDPSALALVEAIRSGDTSALEALLGTYPGLASARLSSPKGTRALLHVVADWPGFFHRGPQIVRLLIRAGADPDARTGGANHAETPLHWTASSDDFEVAAALLDGGADPDAPGGSIGTPLANAVGYGCWNVARLLVARGAHVDTIWQAAALGLSAQVEAFLSASPPPSSDDLDEALWQACHGGQLRMAEYLASRGADVNARPGYAKGSALDVAAAADTQRRSLVYWLRGQGAKPSYQLRRSKEIKP